MKRILSALLISSVVLTSVPADAHSTPDWLRVKAMRAGSPIDVRTTGEEMSRRQYFVSASDDALVLLDPLGALLPAKATSFMLAVLRHHPEALTQSSAEFVEGDFRFTPEGLYYLGVSVAAHDDVVRTVARTDVVELQSADDTRPLPKWVMPTVVTLAVFAGLTLVTRGLFPICLIQRCD